MKPLLAVSALVLLVIGAAQLLFPVRFHALNGVEIDDVDLLSEVRAAGGLLVALGLVVARGVVREPRRALRVAAVAYLAYGLARLVAIAFDGPPGVGLLGATAAELALGVACAAVLRRTAVKPASGVPSPDRTPTSHPR
ncbi:DUF4345 domain-containing protein [Actinosynnema sp. NPDC020468]|uniref:DUF4345 domain-containing protein n=1 Tax=Actinosynnema sp. NPDC020468 TaxID=3154488 RepID=UPI0033F642EC